MSPVIDGTVNNKWNVTCASITPKAKSVPNPPEYPVTNEPSTLADLFFQSNYQSVVMTNKGIQVLLKIKRK